MRELRVEDALMYLDQVKMEFGDRPQIYNEFLDIMKTFKSQQIDTPGVIKRVSSLFDGNRRLVLGFNTFLPEGYKIEIPVDNNGRPMAAVFRTPGQAGFTLINSEPGGMMENGAGAPPGGGPPNTPQQQPSVPPTHPPTQPPHGGAAGTPQQPPMGQQQAQPPQQAPQGPKPLMGHRGGMHGMPMQHQGQPPMGGMDKGFPPQQGMPNGLGGPQRPMGQMHMVRNHVGGPVMQQQPQQPPQGQRNTPLHQGHMVQQQQQQQDQYREAQQQQQYMQQQQQQQQQQQPHADQQQQQSQQPVEFDHAINYVTTIKKRFATEPDTYKKFLEILHTYQKEQRGIKEVLDEVSILFADHPDLLKDFTYFLPDAVQEQAKVQLDAAVRQAEQRKSALEAKAAVMHQANVMKPSLPTVGSEYVGVEKVTQVPIPFGAKAGRTEEREREICRSAIYGYVSFDPVRPPRKHELTPAKAAQKFGRPRTIPDTVVQPTTTEEAFFERAKAHLNRKELGPDKPSGSRRHTPHTEFIKCLHLFAAGILTKDELLSLLRGLFLQGHAPKSGVNAGGGASHPRVAAAANQLLREFEQLLISRGPYAHQQQRKKDASPYGSVTIREIDDNGRKDVTPSYRFLPKDYPASELHTHAGQSEADASVLNNVVVSVGNERSSPSLKQRLLYSPEDYDGMRIRKNRYEEAMAMVEDERFETDMAIERNSNALRAVEPLAQEVTMLREKEEKDGQPIGRLHYKLRNRSLNINQVGAIARLYGDKGDEVIHHLIRNPVSVLPIVFNRLREKENEWRKKRKELNPHWRALCESNYEGSLDTLCWFYRREIEKSLSHEEIIQSCKRVKKIRTKKSHLATSPVAPTFSPGHQDEKMLLFQQHSSFKASNSMPHHEAYECLSLQMMNGVAKTNADREKVSRIWSEFIVPWFNLPAHWFLDELRDKARSDKSSHIVKYANGQEVRTAFGDGVILSLVEGGGIGVRYKVQLPFGVAIIRPSCILHHLPTNGEKKFTRVNGTMYPLSDEGVGDDVKKLEDTCHLMFGTEKVFIFMRLYCALVSLLGSVKGHLEHAPSVKTDSQNGDSTAMDIDSEEPREITNELASKTSSFRGLISKLKEYIDEDIEFKSYEMSCRTMCKKHVHELAALPRLVEKCADALVKVAREDVILSLFDLSQIKDMGPVRKRKESLNVVNDGLYRIQYEPKEELLHCCYMARDRELLLHPRVSTPSVTCEGEVTESSAHVERESDLQDAPPGKRMKLE